MSTMTQKHSHARQGNRRSHHALKKIATVLCEKCKKAKLPHRACKHCGDYKGKKVVDMTKRLGRKNKKN